MVSGFLLDVNALLALGWLDHQHHRAAKRWFTGLKSRRWATCPLTECGFIRIGSNPRMLAGGGDVQAALQVMMGLRRVAGHQFWPDDFSPGDDAVFPHLQGHKQVTDAYLLAVAHRHKGVLATFDGAIATLAQRAYDNDKNVLLIPAGD